MECRVYCRSCFILSYSLQGPGKLVEIHAYASLLEMHGWKKDDVSFSYTAWIQRDSVCSTWQDIFFPKGNSLACRHTFRQLMQRADKTMSRYVAELRALAATCAFAAMKINWTFVLLISVPWRISYCWRKTSHRTKL